MKKKQIAVIGTGGSEEYPFSKPDPNAYRFAYQLGQLIAEQNCILICGGMGGVMAEACRGAKEKGGLTVGVIAGIKRNITNEYVDVEIVSGSMNCAEENLIISMSDGVIAIGGGAGTLQELAIAYRNKKPTVAIKDISGWAAKLAQKKYLDERRTQLIGTAITPAEALTTLLKILD
ncbi:MAG TPA: TIGR00725 family protein [Patescibacteria group bacterium]|nr:TIGR00725 family protein [Patescibacteria group bacterium]